MSTSNRFKTGGIRIIPNTDGSQTNPVEFADASNTLAITIQAPDNLIGTTGDIKYILPPSGPTGVQSFLASNASGAMYWAPAPSGSNSALTETVVSTTPYTLLSTDQVLLLVGAANVINLPQAGSLLRSEIIFLNRGTGTVTLVPYAGDTIEGLPSYQITPGASYKILPNS